MRELDQPMMELSERIIDLIESASTRWSDELFEQNALALYHAQRGAIPIYDEWCRYELSQRKVTSWREIPALPISAYKRSAVYDPNQATTAVWRSSGTTQTERSEHRLASTRAYEASLDAGVSRALLPDVVDKKLKPLRCVQLQPSAAAGADDSSLTHMFDRIRTGPWCIDFGSFVSANYQLDFEAAWSALAECAQNDEPVLVLSTSFALLQLFDEARAAAKTPLRLATGSRVVDTGGYKGRTREVTRVELLQLIEYWFGVPSTWCENEYGMSELSSQAWIGNVAESAGFPLPLQQPARWTPPWFRVRVVDPETLRDVSDGESGLLVFHDLANVWSCAAIRSEDIGIRRGDTFELIGRAPGATLKGCSLRLEDVR